MGKSFTKYCPFLASTMLFKGSTPEEIDGMLGCLESHVRHYKAGVQIFRIGDVIRSVGMVIEGRVSIESVDVWGNVSILGSAEPGDVFGEAYAAVPDEPMMVNIVAAEDSTVIFMNLSKVLTTCSRTCPNHARTSTNMTAIIAKRSLAFAQRIIHVAPRTIRGKVLAYLSSEAERMDTREFDIPYNRQALADYLCVDRSALSAELSRMQKAGLIETHRSHFVLK